MDGSKCRREIGGFGDENVVIYMCVRRGIRMVREGRKQKHLVNKNFEVEFEMRRHSKTEGIRLKCLRSKQIQGYVCYEGTKISSRKQNPANN